MNADCGTSAAAAVQPAAFFNGLPAADRERGKQSLSPNPLAGDHLHLPHKAAGVAKKEGGSALPGPAADHLHLPHKAAGVEQHLPCLHTSSTVEHTSGKRREKSLWTAGADFAT